MNYINSYAVAAYNDNIAICSNTLSLQQSKRYLLSRTQQDYHQPADQFGPD